MKWITNQKISHKINSLIVLSLLFLAVTGTIGFASLKAVNANAKGMYEDKMLPNEALSQLITISTQIDTYQTKLILGDARVDRAGTTAKLDELKAQDAATRKQLEGYGKEAVDQDLYKQYLKLVDFGEEHYKRVKELLSENNATEAYVYYDLNFRTNIESIVTVLRQMKSTNLEIAEQFNQQNSKQARSIMALELIVVLAAIVICGTAGLYISRMINRPIKELQKVMAMAESGNLAVKGSYQSKDELGELTKNFNGMIGAIREMVSNMTAQSSVIAANTEKLLSNAETMTLHSSHNAEELQEVASQAVIQSHSIQESSRAVEEMAAGVQKITEATASVADFANHSSRQADTGSERIERIHGQMNAILVSSKETEEVIRTFHQQTEYIGKAVHTIQEIAEEVNILSLNASIEAARAGEYGRGFAVVAEEVKRLADHSKQSSLDIVTIVNRIQERSSNAVMLVDKEQREVQQGMMEMHAAKIAFEEINASVQQLTEQLHEVSASAEEISASTEEVTATLLHLNGAIEQSSNQTVHVAQSTNEQVTVIQHMKDDVHDLSGVAVELQGLARKFKL
ncbi:methyl-accepting chemotaxis protein [Paenibacillus dokdonensis]|uniref:Methyl-accepting chemotaxis protein n=1 Tax=Paenibacillus dokdonensis TaxID=2567944 RepID=A0ABU6GNB9_9BACL|nr:methyl-accepting chemotaxis protein [Paenibacillus dokdonensis]MEC0241247.1 methyl-accepting chemotaxis protein [Paenibacillus dokdonensis]